MHGMFSFVSFLCVDEFIQWTTGDASILCVLMDLAARVLKLASNRSWVDLGGGGGGGGGGGVSG